MAGHSIWNATPEPLSVPNRERWLTAPDVFDYPPNYFLRWNVKALKSFLSAHGFEIVSCA